jgi:hypothetical protein
LIQRLESVQPKVVFVVLDGPRDGNESDKFACCEVQQVVNKSFKWDCELVTHFADNNLGCAKRISSGISWVFDQVEEAIILEDDCIPELDFFRFSSELLEKYRTNSSVFSVCARNFGDIYSNCSYALSKYPNIWGWATWRRAWNHYDYQLNSLNAESEKIITDRIGYWKARLIWLSRFYCLQKAEKKYTWDFQWVYSSILKGGLSVLPSSCLAENIGFNPLGTHTIDSKRISMEQRAEVAGLDFPLTHPALAEASQKLDKFIEKQDASYVSFGRVLLSFLKHKYFN